MWLFEAGDGLWAGCRAGAASISSRGSLPAVVPLPWPCSPAGPSGGLQRGADGVSSVPRCSRAGFSLCLPWAPWPGGLGGLWVQHGCPAALGTATGTAFPASFSFTSCFWPQKRVSHSLWSRDCNYREFPKALRFQTCIYESFCKFT